MSLDVITIGDTSTDTVLFIDEEEARVVCNVKKHLCEICFDYAEKIPVKSIHESIGGNATNAAVGLSRLGLKAGIYTIIGKDNAGEEVLKTFTKEKVNPLYLHQEGFTNRSTIISIHGERTIFSYHEKRQYDLPKIKPVPWMYVTSMKSGFEKVFTQLLEHLRFNPTNLIYNPGTYQLLAGITASQAILQKTTVLILNKEEASEWLKKPPTTDIEELLFELTKFGTKAVIITDAQNGSYGFDGINYYHCPVYPTKLIEMTGAGDSYATAVTAALYYGLSLKEAMRWGSINAASVVSKVGSQDGLLNYKDLKLRLSEHEKIKAQALPA
jgi:sugar/nucleoside kinase (ribokinase family)